MFLAIYLNELRKNLKGIAFYIFTGLLLFGTCFFVTNTQPGTTFLYISFSKEWHNAPIIIARLLASYTLVGVLFTMVMVGRTVTKDFSAKIHDFFFTIPISKFQYLGGRFFGGLTANLLIFIAVVLGFLLGPLKLEPQYYGPFRLSAYILPTFIILIPNLLLVGSVFFALATLTRKMVITYISGVVFFMVYALTSMAVYRLENDMVKILIDPFGISALMVLSKFWTIAEINTRSMPLDFPLILNRVVWLAVSVAIMVLTLKRFRFVSVLESKKKSKEVKADGSEAKTLHALEKIKPVVIDTSRSQNMAQFFHLVKIEFKRIFFHPAFLILTLMAMSEIITNFALNVADSGYEIYAFTSKYFEYTSHIWTYMVPLIILFSGVIVWRERDNHSSEFYDTLPIPNWLSFGAKFATLLSIQFIYVVIAMIVGIVSQVVFFQFYHIELGLYLKGLFGIEFMKYFFLTVIFIFIQSLVSNKYLGFFISAAYFLGDLLVFNVLKYENLLLRYGRIPGYIYSNLNGFGHYAPMIIWYTLYWLLFAAILILATALLWRRSNETHLKYRIRWAIQRITPAQKGIFVLLLLAFLGTGCYIYYNRTVLNTYTSRDDLKQMKADYETKFARYETSPQPKATQVNLTIDIYPGKRAVYIKGSYLLKNKSTGIIDEIYLNLSDLAISKINKLEFTPKAELRFQAKEFGFRIFKLAAPLHPGAEIILDFDLEVCVRGFSDNNPKNEIAENGTCIIFSGLGNYKYFPGIGFNKELLIKENYERKKLSLPPRKEAPVLEQADPAIPLSLSQLVTYQAVISTSGDQQVVSNGELVAQRLENGRNYFHFKSDQPIHDELIIASGCYQVAKDQHNGVNLEVYYHKDHAYNIDRMINGLKKGLDFCSATFSPFPYHDLRIVEVPDYMEEGGARSQPTVFIWKEDAGFIRDLENSDRLDDVFGIAAHELGHQWWAYIVNPAYAEGSFVCTETICQYVWEMCFEKEYGKVLSRKYLKREMERYLRHRKRDIQGERPLIRSYEKQAYLGYSKSSVVMYALQDYIGEDKVAAALAKVVKKFGWREDVFATANDLVNELKTVTPDSLQYLVTDSFEKITLYENAAKSAAYEELPDGRYKVSLNVVSHKFYSDSIGVQTEAPLNDYIDIGILGENDRELYLKKHKFTENESIIEIMVDEKPARAGIDPFVILIDRQRENNLIRVIKKH